MQEDLEKERQTSQELSQGKEQLRVDLEAEHHALEAEKRDHAQVSVIKLLPKDVSTELWCYIWQSSKVIMMGLSRCLITVSNDKF